MCCPLRKDKECVKLIVAIHVIPAHNTEDFSSLKLFRGDNALAPCGSIGGGLWLKRLFLNSQVAE